MMTHMDITYLGHSSFKIKGKDTTVINDPFDPDMVGLKFGKQTADIVTISHDHKDHNRVDLVDGVKMVINCPGEYETSGVSVIGIKTYHDDKKGKERGKNTIYVIEIDGVRILHLGDLGHKLSDKQLDEIGDIDVLMIPVGGIYTINAEEATSIARNIEANIVIPMHYQTKGLNPKTFNGLTTAEHFASDIGLAAEKVNKLTVKKELLDEENQKVVLFE